jgi:hypothetical protein
VAGEEKQGEVEEFGPPTPPAPTGSDKPKKSRKSKVGNDPVKRRSKFKVYDGSQAAEASWPPKVEGYVWLNPTKYGVSWYRYYGSKPNGVGNGKTIKNIAYRAHFPWSYMEEKYGQPSASDTGRFAREFWSSRGGIGAGDKRGAGSTDRRRAPHTPPLGRPQIATG